MAAEELLHELSPAERLVLRSQHHVKAAIRALDRDLEHEHHATVDLRNARNLNPGDLDDRDRARLRYFARYLDRVRDRTRELASHLNRGRRIRDNELDNARTLAHDIAHARELVSPNPALDRARDLNHGLNRELDPASAHARIVIIDIRSTEVLRAIGEVLRQQPPTLDAPSLYTLLDDFTTADLTGLDSGTWIIRSGTAPLRDYAELQTAVPFPLHRRPPSPSPLAEHNTNRHLLLQPPQEWGGAELRMPNTGGNPVAPTSHQLAGLLRPVA
ncbi:hypothetical protein ACQEWB_49510 [Streptomyces sp. CA-249302]|uniref:hypothetical protein n=1 Tax=Streptomyces sp. CA-249302 TaxID=3240058 RepID=UPI003D89E626